MDPVFTLIHPHPGSRAAGFQTTTFAVVPGTRLKSYLKQKRLLPLALGCYTYVNGMKVRFSLYEPRVGDVLRMIPVSAMS